MNLEGEALKEALIASFSHQYTLGTRLLMELMQDTCDANMKGVQTTFRQHNKSAPPEEPVSSSSYQK
jgi:hypothetical protein